ncbi:hypothetical protein ACHAXS_001347 [Conticribra weissflogii]
MLARFHKILNTFVIYCNINFRRILACRMYLMMTQRNTIMICAHQ